MTALVIIASKVKLLHPNLYSHRSSGWLYFIFPHYLKQGHNFCKKVMQSKVTVLIFSTNIFCNISHSKKKQVGYYQECTQLFMYSIHYSCKILMKLEFSQQNFQKYPNIKFHENLSGGSRVVPREQTDMMKLIFALHSCANMPKN